MTCKFSWGHFIPNVCDLFLFPVNFYVFIYLIFDFTLLGRRTDSSHLEKLLVSWVPKTRSVLRLLPDDSGATLLQARRGRWQTHFKGQGSYYPHATPRRAAVSRSNKSTISPPHKINTQTSADSIEVQHAHNARFPSFRIKSSHSL